jgi:hypothetical protein
LAPQIPANEPISIVAGDTVVFTKVLADYSVVDGWAMKYRLFGPMGIGAAPIVDKTITPVPIVNGLWQITFAPADTSAVVADASYRLVGQVSLSGETHTIYDATLRILANPITATPTNLLSHAERTLAIIEAKIEGRMTADMEHYQIDGKLVRLRARYRFEVWRQRNPGVAAPQRLVRFS